MKKFICPYSNEVINERNQLASYIRWTKRKHNISSEDLRYKIYLATFGDIVLYDKFKKYYEDGNGLIQFLEEYDIPYKITQFLLDYHNIKKRTKKETAQLGAKRSKDTNLKRYGVDQTFKVKEFDEKRKSTYKEKYGVENPFEKSHFSKIDLDDIYKKKYGINHKEYKSLKSKAAWSEKTDEEREEWLSKSILKDKSMQNALVAVGSNQSSKPEHEIGSILIEDEISITSQKRIKRYAFDYELNDYGILIEFNGDLFHANPKYYKSSDILPVVKKTAQEIWDKDEDKCKVAQDAGYLVVYIWEDEVKLKSRSEIRDIIYEKIEDKINKKIERKI